MSQRILLGRGVLTWPRTERVSDRYGTVRLLKARDVFVANDLAMEHCGKLGRLVAVVTETRESGHIGDIFHGIFPSTPEVGDEITLGEGVLFDGKDEDGPAIGISPVESKESWWLDPHQLYRVHEQTVMLCFEPTEGAVQ